MLLDRLAFFPLFCLFLPSLAWVYGSLSSKYSVLVCVLSLLCVHCSMFTHKQHKQTQHACAMFYLYSLLLTVCRCEWECTLFCCFGRCVTPLDCIWAYLWESNGLFQSNNTSSTTHTHRYQTNKHTHTHHVRGVPNWRALGESAQYGPDMRPETRKADQHPPAC